MIDAFRGMSEGVLAVFGQDAFLRGDVPCRVAIQRGVETVGSDDNVVVLRTVATFLSGALPRREDTLTHPDGSFVVDSPLRENGYTKRWIVREA